MEHQNYGYVGDVSGHVTLWVHMDATLQPTRKIIARLLQEDAAFFRQYHYLNPLLVDDADQTTL
jgi:hypothetical protein